MAYLLKSSQNHGFKATASEGSWKCKNGGCLHSFSWREFREDLHCSAECHERGPGSKDTKGRDAHVTHPTAPSPRKLPQHSSSVKNLLTFAVPSQSFLSLGTPASIFLPQQFVRQCGKITNWWTLKLTLQFEKKLHVDVYLWTRGAQRRWVPVLAGPKHRCAARGTTRGWPREGENVKQHGCSNLCVVKLCPNLYNMQKLCLIKAEIYLHVIYSLFRIIHGLF